MSGPHWQPSNWHEFLDSVVIEITPNASYAPTEVCLDQFEADNGFKLPLSYREFMLLFGPGCFSSNLRISSPGYSDPESLVDLTFANKSLGYSAEELAESTLPTKTKSLLRRLVWFGIVHGNEWLGWDPIDVFDSSTHEYAVYQVDWRRDDVIRLAGSFWDAIVGLCGQLFAEDPEYDETTMGPQKSFERYTRP